MFFVDVHAPKVEENDDDRTKKHLCIEQRAEAVHLGKQPS
jgi:hypothetical protein